MPFELQTDTGGVTLILSGRLGVQQARPLWDALQPVIAGDISIRLQAEGLDEMDTSITQILLRLSNRAGQFQMGGTSDGFFAALKGRGLETFLVAPPARPEIRIPPSLGETELDRLARAARQGHG